MPNHATLSASAAKRWTECTPSARLNAQAEERASPYALEGTDAHSLGQYLIEKEFGIPTTDPTENLSYYNQEMQECAEIYLATVKEIMADVKSHYSDPQILVEQRVRFDNWVPEGFGTADCIILADGTLHVIDYKHGAGILVEAEDNIQMKCYALGTLAMFGDIYDVDSVCMTIVQPRKENISSWIISVEDLLTWAEEFLKPRAHLAYEGKGEFVAGSHCQFCKVKATCRKRAEANLELAQHDFALPETLDATEIAVILSKVDDLVSWASDVKEYALDQALAGQKFDGYKVVEGRSTRKYTDEDAVAYAAKEAGYNPFEQKVLGITAMTKLMGKTNFEDILGAYITKPQGKPTLVPITDKRPEFNSAVSDFNDNNGGNDNE